MEMQKLLAEYMAQDRLSEQEAQQTLRQKLDSLLSSEVVIEDIELPGFIDIPAIQALMDDFYALTHIPMAIIDLKGRVLVGVGWQPICLRFHRVHPETHANCIESDLLLSAGVPVGEFKLYKCRNNMWDIATPIMVGNQHAGNFFSGQFFFDDELPDYDLFRAQARQYGFNEEEYLTVLDQAPRLSRETLNRAMAFFVMLAQMISRLSYSNFMLVRSLAEREALMSSLRESEQRWATTLTSVGDGVVATDEEGKITFLNHVAEELTGWTLLEAAQKPVEEVFRVMNESNHQEVCNPVRRALETAHGTELDNDALLVRKDGTKIAIDDSAAPIRSTNDQILGAVLVFRDITERRRREQEIARSNQELEQFAYIASHDLSEPLRKIEVFGNILTNASSRLDERERDHVQRMISSARRMRQMVDGLLILSRVSTQEQTFSQVDLTEIVKEVLGDLEVQIKQTDGRVEVGYLPCIEADKLQLYQLFENLIGNALKYHRPGTPPVIKITSQAISPIMVQILVEDQGIGFEECYVERIFQPFRRLVAKSQYEGTGLGLAICKRIVERHNGSITARSIPGQGSTFVVTLPLHQSQEAKN